MLLARLGYPFVIVSRLFGTVARELVVVEFVLAGQVASAAVFTQIHVNNHAMLNSRGYGRGGGHDQALLWSHFSICTRQELDAVEWLFLMISRLEVSRFRQPPLSGELPGSPIGS